MEDVPDMKYLLLFFAVSSLSPSFAVEMDDSVLESGRNGTDVVLLSVAYVQQAAIFAEDKKLLRRIAYVETRDGSDRKAFNEGTGGGIWAVSEDDFDRTQNDSDSLLGLVQKHEQIMEKFGISWKELQWGELSKPFYSALAARLVLFTARQSIPNDTNVATQAQFWRDNYNSDGSVDHFIKATKRLEGEVRYCVRTRGGQGSRPC